MPGEHLHTHFFSEGHDDLADLSVNIIDRTDMHYPTDRKVFWIYKLYSFVPKGLNQHDFI